MHATGPDPNEPLKVLPAGWITKTEALQRTGRSIKRFERAVAAAGIPKRTLEIKHRKPTPIYRSKDIDMLVKRPATPPGQSLTVRPTRAVAPTGRTQALPPAIREAIAAAAAAIVPVDRMHLVTMKQAHALGYSWKLLREWKNSTIPPGIGSGSGFKFSVSALNERLNNRIKLLEGGG